MKKIICFLLGILIICLNSISIYAEEKLQLINYENILDSNYTPTDLITIKNIPTSKEIQVSKIIDNDLQEMYKQMLNDNINNFFITSGYRGYYYQKNLYNNKVQEYLNLGYTKEKAEIEAATIVAKPGTSEHQTGLALDFSYDGSLEENFEKTEVGKWLAENSYKYGFILRYPKDKTEITKIIYEPWHFRYVGIDLATTLFNKNLCLEEYYQPTNNVQNKLSNILDKVKEQ